MICELKTTKNNLSDEHAGSDILTTKFFGDNELESDIQ